MAATSDEVVLDLPYGLRASVVALASRRRTLP
jgi:hypothetical protein